MAAHIELAIEENLKRGMPAEEARRSAMIRFGGLEQAKQHHREARGLPRSWGSGRERVAGCSLRLAHAAQEAHICGGGGPDSGSGKHREYRVATLSSVPGS